MRHIRFDTLIFVVAVTIPVGVFLVAVQWTAENSLNAIWLVKMLGSFLVILAQYLMWLLWKHYRRRKLKTEE
jgi:hypothetical protein